MTTLTKAPAPSPRAVYWGHKVPLRCNLCDNLIKTQFVDGIVAETGQWGLMDVRCHAIFGRGLGTGRGQRFTKQPDGRWLKTAG